MAHLVEKMAYAGETPWHGLGTKVDEFRDVDDMLKVAGLDWEVKKVPIYSANGKQVDRLYGLERSSDQSILSVVGKRYVPTQNREALHFFTQFAERGHVSLETAGSLDDGRYVWGLAKLKSEFMLNATDKVMGYLLVAVPHVMGVSIQAKVTSVRVVCNNTLSMALGGTAQFTMPHLTAFDESLYDKAAEALGLGEEKMGQFQRQAEILTKIKLGADDTTRLLAKIFQSDVDADDVVSGKIKPNRKLAALLEAIDAAPGSDLETAQGTAWGVLNGVTFLNSHVAGRSPGTRLYSNWFGANQQASGQVLKDLLALAD